MQTPKDNLIFTLYQVPSEGQTVHFWSTADVDRDPECLGTRGRFADGHFVSADGARKLSPPQVFVWREVNEATEAQAIAAIEAAVRALEEAARLVDEAGLGLPIWTHLEKAHVGAQRALAEAAASS